MARIWMWMVEIGERRIGNTGIQRDVRAPGIVMGIHDFKMHRKCDSDRGISQSRHLSGTWLSVVRSECDLGIAREPERGRSGEPAQLLVAITTITSVSNLEIKPGFDIGLQPAGRNLWVGAAAC